MPFSEERFSHSTENCEDNNSDKNFFQKHNEDPYKKVFGDQTRELARGVEELQKERVFQTSIVNKQTHCGNSLQSKDIAQNTEDSSKDQKQILEVCKENERRDDIENHQENSCEIRKGEDLNLSENKECISLNHDEVGERSYSSFEIVSTLQKNINETSDETNCEFSKKATDLPEISSKEQQTGVNNLLEAIDRNQKPIQCEEINYSQNSCEEINSNENFVKYRDVANVIDDSVLDDSQFTRDEQNLLQKESSGENYILENADNQVSSSGINPDCDFPHSQTGPSSSEQTEISSETHVGPERRESSQNLQLYEKNNSDGFGFIDFSTLSSPERSGIPSFNANKSGVQSQEGDNAQNYLFYEKSHRNKSLDLRNDAGTDLEFTPLQNMRPDRGFTENAEGFLSYQDMSENFSTPNKSRNYKRTEAFEPEKNNSNFVFLNQVQGGLRPQTNHGYIPFENVYQYSSSTIPVSETAQSIPSYAEAFSRPGLALNNSNSVYTALYPEFVTSSHSSRKDVGYTARSSISNRDINYDHHQHEDYTQNLNPDGNNSTFKNTDNHTYSDIFRLQQMNSVEDYFSNEAVSKHAETTRNDPNRSYEYRVFTPQIYEEPGRYEEANTLPTHCEEIYNYSVRQEKVRTYAVRHEEVHTVEDLVQFEEGCSYPASPTGMSSMGVSSHYRESNGYQSAFSSEAALSSNYFRMNAPSNQNQVTVNVQPIKNGSVSSLQLSPDQTVRNSKDKQMVTLKAPQDFSRIRTRSSSATNVQIPSNPPTLDAPRSPAVPNPNKQTPKTPSRYNTQTPQGLFRTNVATPQNSSWTNLQVPQGTARLSKQTANTPIRLIKPSPQYPTNQPQGFVPGKGLKLLTSPSSSLQSKSGCFQDQDWRRRMDLDFERNRRINFESARVTASDNGYPKGIFIERHFRCDRCEHSFARKEDLIRHRFTTHEKFRVVKPASYMFLQ